MENHNLAFVYKDLAFVHREKHLEDWQKILGIEATLTILSDNRTFFSEPHVNVAEFALKLNKWLRQAKIRRGDFIYSPIESEEHDFIYFKNLSNGWKIGSIFQRYEELEFFSFQQIAVAIGVFTDKLFSEADKKFGIELSEFLKD